jgi:D-alanyl-D-alanine carboxypeptidase
VPAQVVHRRASVEPAAKGGTHTVQVGAYGSEQEAQRRLADVARQTSALLSGFTPTTQRFNKDKTQYYRARFSGFDAAQAQQTCERLKKQRIDCFVASEE